MGWPTSVSYPAPAALPHPLAGWGDASQPQHAGWPLHADPVPDNFPAFMPGYLPPLLEQQALPAAQYGQSAPVPPVPAWGAAAAQAGPRAKEASKRSATDEAGSPQLKRPLRHHPGAEAAAAAAGPSGPAWPLTRPAGSAIDCPRSVLDGLRASGRRTRQAEFERYDLKIGRGSITAVVQACSKVAGRLVAEHGEKGVYTFDDVVLTAGTKIARSDKLDEATRIGTVYLELGKGEGGTAMLSDLHLLIPETASETPQTSEPVYSNDEEKILEYMRSEHKGNKRLEVGRLAKQHEAEEPAPSHPFKSPEGLKSYLKNHKSFFNTLGCEHIYQVKKLLRECEDVMGGPRKDGEHRLTLMRKGQAYPLLWVVKDGYTTHVIDARDEKRAKRILEQARSKVMGAQAAQLARGGVMPFTQTDEVRNIVQRHEKALKALAWGDDLAHVVRTLSLRFEMARSDPEYGSVTRCGEDGEIMEFDLRPPGAGGNPARGLRWVREGKLSEIILFEEGQREEAIAQMADFKKDSNAKRIMWAATKANATAGAGGVDG